MIALTLSTVMSDSIAEFCASMLPLVGVVVTRWTPKDEANWVW